MEPLNSFQPIHVQLVKTKSTPHGVSGDGLFSVPFKTEGAIPGGEETESGKEATMPFSSILGSIPVGTDPKGASIEQTLQTTSALNDGSPEGKGTEPVKDASMPFSSVVGPFPVWTDPKGASIEQTLQTTSALNDGFPEGKGTEPVKDKTMPFSSVVGPSPVRVDSKSASIDQALLMTMVPNNEFSSIDILLGAGLGGQSDGPSVLPPSTNKELLYPESSTSNISSSTLLPEYIPSSTKGFENNEIFPLPGNTAPGGNGDPGKMSEIGSSTPALKEEITFLRGGNNRLETLTTLQSGQASGSPEERGIVDTSPNAEQWGGDPFQNSSILGENGLYDQMNAELKGPPTQFVQDEVSETRSLTGNRPQQDANLPLGQQKPELETTARMTEEGPKTHDTSTSKFERLEVYQQIDQEVIGSMRNGQEKIKLALDPPQQRLVGPQERGMLDSSPNAEQRGRDPFQNSIILGEKGLYDRMNAELKGPPTLFVQDEISETLSPTGNHPHQEANFTLGHQKPGSEGTAPMPEEVPRTSDTSTSKFERLEVYQQIGQKVIWSIQNGQEKIKLALDPPQLGNIYMEITKDKENIRTTIWADTPGAKGILESNQTQLHKLLRDDGFNLEKFDVFVQEGMGSFQERREKWINQEERFQGGFEEDEGSSSHPLEIATVQTNLSVRGSHYVDCFV